MSARGMVMMAFVPLMVAGPVEGQIGNRAGGAGRSGERAEQARAEERDRGRTGVGVGVTITLGGSRGRYDECRYDSRRYDDRWDRRGGRHSWSEPWRWGRGRDCDDHHYRSGHITLGIGNRVAFEREYHRLHERLMREHERWHRRHGWYPRGPGWHRAHRALHERLERQYARFYRW